MAYAVCALVGLVLSFAARSATPGVRLPSGRILSLLGLIGSCVGALLFELPADYFGWTAGIAGQAALRHGIGGRTVLGGLLGGWLAVEVGKRALGIRRPTGDGFALPLAIGLGCGRVGCLLAGCCAGRVSTGHDWWRAMALPGHDGALRFPAQLTEVIFHGACACVLFVLARRGHLRDRLFVGYVALYAAFRFILEGVRDNPAVALGLTYYQLLAAALFLPAAAVVIARTSGAPASAPSAGASIDARA